MALLMKAKKGEIFFIEKVDLKKKKPDTSLKVKKHISDFQMECRDFNNVFLPSSLCQGSFSGPFWPHFLCLDNEMSFGPHNVRHFVSWVHIYENASVLD